MSRRPWHVNIEQETLRNKNWRKVLDTEDNLQVVLMSVPVGQELGWERHTKSDQFFRIEQGQAMFETDGHKPVYVGDGDVVVIPRNTWHNVVNDSEDEALKFYTIYGPPHHAPRVVDRTHADEKRRTRKR